MTPSPQSAHLRPLLLAWLALVGLTLLGNQLGTLLHGAAWLQVAVAGIVWLKGYLVADRFIEMREAHLFIRNVLRGFIAFAPLALVGTAFFGARLARWATL